ncbi:hypothetical protein [Methylobacterium sp. ARG-1]|uniref:hypothetical protein n=1 Tax=Methylobacterium sp. ARG-1 TaxID=1692501 RepID=UPI0006822B1A|nr:hypothetical protein [Methylobacterium sp. ARG-1]KNY20753.1 hypothetical protein AKJ13_20885 [Methylobacterium sp. ARG-1]
MNALKPPSAFVAVERFDTVVARAFAADPATRHTRDRLIAEVHAGRHDALLLRAAEGLDGLPPAVERRAAVNTIDFAFEPLVLPGLSVPQALAYFEAVERSVQVGEARGLERPGPLWVDTVHHTCVFSVLFQFAAYLRRHRSCDRIVLLHQGTRPEPRLDVAANLLSRVHGLVLLRVPLRESWFSVLARATTPQTAIFYLVDTPRAGLSAPPRHRPAQVELHAGGGLRHSVDVVSGSAAFARRLGATHLVLDYPEPDRLRLAPSDPGRPPACPLVDWVFWPALVPAGAEAVTRLSA